MQEGQTGRRVLTAGESDLANFMGDDGRKGDMKRRRRRRRRKREGPDSEACRLPGKVSWLTVWRWRNCGEICDNSPNPSTPSLLFTIKTSAREAVNEIIKTRLSETETKTKTRPSETKTRPSETETKTRPSETKTRPSETKTKTRPSETETKTKTRPSETKTKTKPFETKTKTSHHRDRLPLQNHVPRRQNIKCYWTWLQVLRHSIGVMAAMASMQHLHHTYITMHQCF
ncbi:hypothetical protein GWK47_028064 [Chionoecetes opilio]|uniref:Uncharacterized protein n=1 Tax=Chionoecetes opilio TaxID=41210 RepID=A0A8J5D5W0_CHIOP|nr:hypothetical protein GWK47_028064 [Chionoecetes opilio]